LLSEKRGSLNVLSDGDVTLKEVFSSDISYNHWIRYQKKYSYAYDISWNDVKESVLKLWDLIDV